MFAFFFINLINIILIIFMVFVEHKRLHRVAIWLLIFSLLPIVGFLLYLIFGIGLPFRRKKERMIFDDSLIRKRLILENRNNISTKFSEIIAFNLLNNNSLCLKNEEINIFTSGNEFFCDLEKEIKKAKRNIYIFSYIIKDDIIGEKLFNLLIEKRKENLEIIILYDAFGSRSLHQKFKRKCQEVGIKLFGFFPTFLKIPLLQTKINYRNHRKIFIIDNEISYIGGINFRKDHFNYDKKLFPWKDTQIKIKGETTLEILNTFLSDLKLCDKNYVGEVFPIKNDYKGSIFAQLLNSSPLNRSEKFEESLIKAINFSKKEIIIESPYFIIDDKMYESIKQALYRNVEVKIYIPQKIDRKSVHFASLFHCKKLLEIGAKVFMYQGFLHSKCVIIDKEMFIVGSANFDMRSFYLNFESSVIIFDKALSLKYTKEIEKNKYVELKINDYKKMPVIKKLALSFSQLFSPIMWLFFVFRGFL